MEQSSEYDKDKDGVDRWSRSTFAYNERGDLVEGVLERRDDDGGATSVDLRRYDTNGTLQETLWQWFDADSRLEREVLTEYTHEPTGAQVLEYRVDTDFPAAGPPTVRYEQWMTRRYDSRGNLVEASLEEEHQSGQWIGWCFQLDLTLHLDPQGRPLEQNSSFTSFGCDDGEVRSASDIARTFSYDRWGNLLQDTSRYESNGNPGSIWTTIYEYWVHSGPLAKVGD